MQLLHKNQTCHLKNKLIYLKKSGNIDCIFDISGVDVDTKRHSLCAGWKTKESEGARGSVGLSGL